MLSLRKFLWYFLTDGIDCCCYSVPYGLGYPAVKHRHHAKYVVIHEYDDKDNGDKGYYYGPGYVPSYDHDHISNYDADKDKSSYDFDHDHYRFVHNIDDAGKEGPHAHAYTYGGGYKHGTDDADKKSAYKKTNKLPKKFAANKDKGKKYEYTYYDDYSYPTVGFKEDFTQPTAHTHKTLDSTYLKSGGTPSLKIVTPTVATLNTYVPNQATYKASYVGPTVQSFVDTGYYVSPKIIAQPTLVPYKSSHSSTPLNAEFQEYNTRKEHTEGYIHSDDRAPFAYPATHLQSPQYENVKDGIINFAAEIREQFGGDDLEPDKNTLEQFRKEDEEDAKAHAEFVSSIENDHKAF